MVSKFQHLVFYVNDIEQSKDFYMRLFDLQFSATNHPDSSAAMKLAHQEMRFFSFGFYHHDVCMVQQFQLKMDNESMLHYSIAVHDKSCFEKIKQRAKQMAIPIQHGRMLPSAAMQHGWDAFCFQDPNKHWIEIILKK